MTSEHRRHDRLLVTRFAAGDSYPNEQLEAERLVAACSECASLAADIRLLTQRTRELPVPHRTRDFRISAEQAERLRGSWLERLMRGIAAPGWSTALRPLAGAAMAIGLTLAVVGAMPLGAAPAEFGAAAGDQKIDMSSATAAPAAEPLATADTDAPVFAPGAPDDRSGMGGVEGQEADPNGAPVDPINDAYIATPAPVAVDDGGRMGQMESAAVANNQALLYAGLAVAVLGLVALAVTWLARRRFGDALLR
jgi:hypothetical protein